MESMQAGDRLLGCFVYRRTKKSLKNTTGHTGADLYVYAHVNTRNKRPHIPEIYFCALRLHLHARNVLARHLTPFWLWKRTQTLIHNLGEQKIKADVQGIPELCVDANLPRWLLYASTKRIIKTPTVSAALNGAGSFGIGPCVHCLARICSRSPCSHGCTLACSGSPFSRDSIRACSRSPFSRDSIRACSSMA
jgi:hypothetical protein